MHTPHRRNLAVVFVASTLAFLPLHAQTTAKIRLSIVTSVEAQSGQENPSAFGTENVQAVLSMVTAYVIDSGAYEVIGSAEREAAIKELEFSLSELAEDANRLRLGRMLAAERLLSARCGKAGDYFVIQLSLVDVETGIALGSALGKYRSMGTLLESLRSLSNDCLGIRADDGQGKLRFITVRNSTEFLNALGSDRVIILEPGSYDLSKKNDIKHSNLAWKNNFDGFYPVVKSVDNLTIRSSGDAEVLIAPAYGWVLEFQTSRNLRFQGIRFAHTKPGYCVGGVLRFEHCDNIEISDCSLDGSGTYGLELAGSRNLSMTDSLIQNCTYGIMQLFDSSDAFFKDCEFYGNREFDLISLSNSSNVDFADCEMRNNSGSALFSIDDSSYGLVLTNCRISGNRLRTIADPAQKARFVNCVIDQ